MEGIEDDQIFAELQSGSNTTNRPKLKECLRFIRNGDVLICTKLDRLAHSMADLADILKTVETKGANLKVLDQREIDTTTANGRLLFGIVASVAEFEHALIKDRQLVGLSCACGTKKKGAGQDEKTGAQECHQPSGEPLFGEGRSSVRELPNPEGWLLLTWVRIAAFHCDTLGPLLWASFHA